MIYTNKNGTIEWSADRRCEDFDCEICDLTFCELNMNKVFDDVPNLFPDDDEEGDFEC
jgi:hypothetical protein